MGRILKGIYSYLKNQKEPTIEELQERMREAELKAKLLEDEAVLYERINKAKGKISKYR